LSSHLPPHCLFLVPQMDTCMHLAYWVCVLSIHGTE
jgi:hypothetical protein